MSTLFLPTEIWLIVATYMGRSEFRSLVLACRNFNNIFTTGLYSELVIKFDDDTTVAYKRSWSGSQSEPKFNTTGENAWLLLKRLETNAGLRNVIRTVHIRNLCNMERSVPAEGSSPNQLLFDASVGVVMRALRDLPVLQRVELTNSEMPTKWLIYLASHSTSNLDLVLHNVSLYGEVEPVTALPAASDVKNPSGSLVTPTRVTARTLLLRHTYWPAGLANFLASPSLKALSIGTLPSSLLKTAFDLMGRPSLPHLQSLTIPYLTHDEVGMLSALINLRELRLLGRNRRFDGGPINIPPDILRKLEVISVRSTLIPAFTAGRKVTSISAEGPLESRIISLASAGPHFGSDVMVTTVDWARCDEWDELLDHLIAKNPGVWHLAVDPLYGPTSEEAILPYISKLAQFRELRTLKFTSLTHVPTERTLDWERRQCEYLKSVGSPFLESISFSEIINWTRHPDDKMLWRPDGIGMETMKRKLQFLG